MAFQLHFPLCPLPWGVDSGSQLLSWTQDIAVTVPQALPEPKPKRKYSLLPVLIVLFLISYGLMALLAVEQDRTIASQRSLISQLFGDSAELSSLKGRFIQKQHAQAQAQAEAKAHSQVQNPSTQDKSRAQVKNDPNAKLPKLPKPPTDTATMEDERRSVMRI